MRFLRRILHVFFGAILASIGLLWFLQGMHLIETQPLLCIDTCQKVASSSLVWTIIGAFTLALGCGFLSSAIPQQPN
ncbi:hypothetical protein [Corynebacterium freiburgense]|uniref:hypothetical protein n=1 Tax=Corynebacterium freiburgense TaxID=556548 RepID=UPI00054F809F|nr:hypothetical protein [Corynebacterium freiburgense]WJZ01760.1 hypothetical protein CFREI_02280 [Corynebacterium freiburgense]